MRQPTRIRHSWATLLLAMLLAALLAAACGAPAQPSDTGEAETPATQGREARVVPTMPPLQMAQPTTMINPTRVAELSATPSPEGEVDLEFGAQVYARLCAECHGAEGEGMTDKGKTLAGLTMEEAALVTLLRTGGEAGRDHLFGYDRISSEGITALHAWLQTLPAPE